MKKQNAILNFRNNYVDINEKGIDLLRSNFAFKHIDYSEIIILSIKNGFLLKNRIFVQIIAVLIIFGSLILIHKSIPFFTDIGNMQMHNISASKSFFIILLIPLFLFVFSLYMIYQSFIKSPILIIKLSDKTYRVRIKEFKTDQLQELDYFLSKKVSNFRNDTL